VKPQTESGAALRHNFTVWSLCLVCLAAVIASAQEPTFKAGARTVAVYATVTSPEGRLVPDLPRDAFAILDNGKPQPLTLFANDTQPITVVLLLDRSVSMVRNFELVEKAAEEFVNAMLPADKARIGSFSNRIQVDPREFTSDKEELLRILRSELQEEGPTPLWNAVNVGITALLHQQGRRVILVFTDGMDSPLNFASHNTSLKDVMKRAEEEDVMVYAIGLAGSTGFANRAPMGGGGRGYGGRGGRGGGYGGGGRRAMDKPDEGLPKIAAVTGGGYFELTRTSDLAATFAKVADELHHQYALGFTPPNLDGKMHALEVHVTNGEGLVARARKSYLARNER
jgi:Ca-activated chloride channel homolog